jgi:hypothetical protein
MQWLVPVFLDFLGISIEGGFNRLSAPDWEGDYEESASLRILGWELAWRIFATAPWQGVGPGEFAGAAFANGLPSALAARDIWTSPHNLVLQLLAETGLVGTTLALAGLGLWLRSSAPSFCRAPTVAGWWILACVAIEFAHALLEYPFWYAHFLAMTALILGIGAGDSIALSPAAIRALFASSAIAGAAMLGTSLRDYFRFELVSPIYAGRSLAPDREFESSLQTLADLNTGLLAPRAELWLFLSLPVDDIGLPEKLAMGNRVMRTWPLREVVLRQCVLLALAGRESEARTLLKQARLTFSNRERMIRDIVSSAPEKARKTLDSVPGSPR